MERPCLCKAGYNEMLRETCLKPSTGSVFQEIISTYQFMLASTCLITDEWRPSAKIDDGDEFHFLVVGAGSAGCVLANRLTENKSWNVLLIEAGDDPPIESYIPYMDSTLYNTKYDWQYKTVPTGKINKALVNERVSWPRGKVLGGSSALNGMIYFQGLVSDFQKWSNLGNPEWHPDILRNFSNKAESLQDQVLLQNPYIRQTYGVNGPQIINTFNSTQKEYTLKVLESYDELGFKIREDLQTSNLMGSGMSRVTAYNGRRASTATSYLSNIQDRPNLKILKNAFVTRILIDKQLKAYGVIVKYGLKKIKIFASLEVVLSAGAINSPQLLMLSGIGPKEHLESKKIRCKVDLPGVGQNLQDHLTVSVPIFGTEPGYEDKAKKVVDVALYSYNRTGYMAQSRIANILVFYVKDNNATTALPEFQSHLLIFERNSTNAKTFFSRYKQSIAQNFYNLIEEYGLYLFRFQLLHPYSRGNVSLDTKDPFDHPSIYANTFDDPRDFNDTVEGIRKLTEIVNTNYFKSIKAFLGRYNWSECNQHKLNSKEYWRCIVPDIVGTIFHPVGTCAMGPDPKSAVVDSRLRVHKVRGLRVIDASIMPNITSCNTNGPTIMIAERGADIIKKDYQYDESNLAA
ncbi:ecdysone oxidase-like [Battus philenor]|uniref:ecdysone oxidase-like n=1 Tax=Battus philenor TaxID=42288 RepID=UPI0035CFC79B